VSSPSVVFLLCFETSITPPPSRILPFFVLIDVIVYGTCCTSYKTQRSRLNMKHKVYYLHNNSDVLKDSLLNLSVRIKLPLFLITMLWKQF